MNICFAAPTGEMNDSLRRCAQEAFGSPIVDLSQTPSESWKDSIAHADLIIGDITAANPAASYAIGLADALGKSIVLLAPIQDSIPPFFGNRKVIVHRWNLDYLREELEKLAAPSDSKIAIDENTPAGKFQKLFGDLLKKHGYAHHGPVEFDGTTFTLREQDMDLPLVQDLARRAKSMNLRVRLL